MNKIKKAVCILGAGAALASAPAFARDGRWEHDGHRHWNHRQVVVVQRHYVPGAPAYVIERPVAIERRPVVYYYPQYYPATGVIVGAAVGAVLGGYIGGRM